MSIAPRRISVFTIAVGGIALLAIACTSLAAQEVETASPEADPEIGSNSESAETPRSSPETPTPVDFSKTSGSFKVRDGRQVLDFEVETYAHGTFRLSDFEGQPVVINFWYPSCPGCRIEKPFIRAAEEKWADRGVVFLGAQLIGIDSIEDGIEFLADNSLTYRNFADHGRFAHAFNVFSYPSTVFLDADHRIFREQRGAITGGAEIGATLIQIFEKDGNFDMQ